jgi:hypothetical protein
MFTSISPKRAGMIPESVDIMSNLSKKTQFCSKLNENIKFQVQGNNFLSTSPPQEIV